jgi:hypothetical protein
MRSGERAQRDGDQERCERGRALGKRRSGGTEAEGDDGFPAAAIE